MKILCLHGRGASGAIFKSQTSSIRSRLTDLDLTFDFVDGPYPCPPAAGLDLFYPPPYFSFYAETPANTTIQNIQQTQSWLERVIEERGPYDMVMTFSQGSSVAVTALLLYEVKRGRRMSLCKMSSSEQSESYDANSAITMSRKNKDFNTPPFKSAIFICGGAPLQLLEQIGYAISPVTKARDLESRSALASMASSANVLSRGSSRWTGTGTGTGGDLSSPLTSNPYPTPLPTPAPTPTHNLALGLDACLDPSYGLDPLKSQSQNQSLQLTFNREDELRREIAGSVKVSIPTVHIYGERDPRYIAGIQLSEVCERANRKVYNHGGGHEIPRFRAVSGAVADLVRWAVKAAEA